MELIILSHYFDVKVVSIPSHQRVESYLRILRFDKLKELQKAIDLDKKQCF